ncbi:MAG TPA: elongation factor G, partial [Acholeplasmataceae bacterium]|nr:elongation factor G [Acholeplasmataceae bacterium]
SISDFLIEEQNKLSSLSMSLIPTEFHDHKFNFLDVPGSDEFVGDLYQALSVVKGAVITIDATKGVEVGTIRVWKEIRKRHIPAVLFINKMDKENIKFDALIEEIREKLGKKAVPFCWPIGKEENFEGFVNIVEMKARIYDGMTSHDAEIWEEKKPKVDELRNMMLESVAETSEALLDKYFNGETLTEEEIKMGLRSGIMNGELTPVLVGSASKAIGIRTMIDMLFDYLPAPNELQPLEGKDDKNASIQIQTVENEPFQGYVFKTTVDPFIGTMSYIKVNRGSLKPNQEVMLLPSKEVRKLSNVFSVRGKQQINNDIYHAGDICVAAKIDGLETGNSLSDSKHITLVEPVAIPNPIMYIAVHPKNKNDEDKISNALHRLNLEDPTFQIQRNKETQQLLIGGQGMTHLNYILERMKLMFKVDVDIDEQKIVYRETIKKYVEAEGKHKKQSGGAGQFGHVFIKFEPSNELFEFHEDVFGGAVPKNYFPAVEKGLIETFEHGPLAGFPVINVKATLYDGSYHSVDSNELSFKLAAALAFKNACEKAQPTILEPIVKLDVTVDEKFVGDVMGDMNKRRGRVHGMNPTDDGSFQVINCEVPESEIVSYAIDLKAMTQGSGQFTREFLRYDEVPQHLIPKIIESYKK